MKRLSRMAGYVLLSYSQLKTSLLTCCCLFFLKLIMYWYGIPDPDTGINLATCVWQSRAHAIAAHSRPHHIQAMRLAASSYERYDLERWTLSKTAGSRRLEVLPYIQSTAGR
jgi:hypothetical protein